MRAIRRALLLAASLLTLGVVLVPAAPASAQTHPAQGSEGECPGIVVGTYPLVVDGTTIGELVITWDQAGGYNCARMNHVGPTYGETLPTGVELVACEATAPGTCDVVWGEGGGMDFGDYAHYAGRVFAEARDRCIYAVGLIRYQNVSRRVDTGGARHCG